MTIKQKILTGYSVAFALMGLVIAWAVVNLVSLGQATNAILSENYRSILAAENMVDALERQDNGILLVFIGEREKGVAQFRENEALFYAWLARAKDNITIGGEAEFLQAIDTNYAQYRQVFAGLSDHRGSPNPLLAPDHYHETIYPLFAKVREACIGLRHLNEETMYAASVTAGKVSRRAIWSTATVAASALTVAIVFSFFLVGRIVRPIGRLMEVTRTITSGDYSVQVPVETSDELGLLALEFNRMAAQLHRFHEMNIEQIIAEKNKGEAILASIEDGLVVFDTHLKVTAINRAARRLMDVSVGGDGELHCADILQPSNVCELVRNTVEKGGQLTLPDEQRIITRSMGDQTRHLLFSVTAIRGKDGRLFGAVLLLRDITRLKEVERLKSEFIMAASHELRTPLTSLGMSIDLLLEHAAPALPEKDRDLLQAAHEEVQRMKALVSDLLDLSRIEAGRIDMVFESVSLATVFGHVLAVFKSQAEMKSVELSSPTDDGLPVVRADANKIAWVLTNLVSNALRYVSQGGHIALSARRIGSRAHISVRDDGIGIPHEYQTRIFQKFVQVKGQEATGTGLGLAICREIVRAHGGTIWVESLPGKGCTFTFTLPLAQQELHHG